VRQWVATEPGRVVNLDKLTYAGNLAALSDLTHHERHTFVQGDIGDREGLRTLLQAHRPRAVINFAAETHVDRSIDGPEEFVQTNVVGVYRLLEAVREYWGKLPATEQGSFRFLQVSTDEVYGSLGQQGAFRETSPYAPNSPYAASKAAADHFVRAYHHTYGLPTLTTNCSNNYGPFQFPEKLIPLMVLNAVEGKPLPVYGDGLNVRDWLFVDEHCAALRTVLAKGRVGEVYHIGGNCERNNLQIVKAICALVDEFGPALPHPRESLMTFVPDRPGHDRRYAVDTSKITEELGWRPTLTVEAGLRQTVQWYLSNLRWVEHIRSGGYRGQRLGLG